MPTRQPASFNATFSRIAALRAACVQLGGATREKALFILRQGPRGLPWHSTLGLMTPHDIHYGLAAPKWQQRAEVLRVAYAAHPERFPRAVPLPPPLPTAAWINKPLAAPALAVSEGAGS